MARFVPGQPVVTAEPSVVVDAGLPVGQHRFQLEVVTDSRRKSAPDIAVVQVQESIAPVAPAPFVLSPAVAPTPIRVVSPGILSPRILSPKKKG